MIKAFYFLMIVLVCMSCKDRNDISPSTAHKKKNKIACAEETEKQLLIKREIGKVVFYLENSSYLWTCESSGLDLLPLLSNLVEQNRFVEERIPQQFYYAAEEGSLEMIDYRGSESVLNEQANSSESNCDLLSDSKINFMFQQALHKARKDTISIFISAGTYNFEKFQTPVKHLSQKGREIRKEFLNRLLKEDLQTIVVKLDFNAKKGAASEINGEQSSKNLYYLWIFGEMDLLETSFTEDYISGWKGYNHQVRFVEWDELLYLKTKKIRDPEGKYKRGRKVRSKLFKKKRINNNIQIIGRMITKALKKIVFGIRKLFS